MFPVASVHRSEYADCRKTHPCIAGFILKFLYAGMLIQLPPDTIRTFFASNPPPGLPESYNESDLFTALWADNQWVPFDYCISVINALDRLLGERGIPIEDFIQTALQKINHGLVIPSRTALFWGKPFLKLFYLHTDVRLLMLRIVNHFTSRMTPGVVQQVVKNQSEREWNSTTVLLMMSRIPRNARIPRKIFDRPFPKYNCDLWTAGVVQAAPLSIRLPAYEHRFMVADSRNICDIIAPHRITISSGKTYIDGKFVGIQSRFAEFCEKNEIDVDRLQIPDHKITVITHDVYSPHPQRLLLQRGCAYGSQVYLYGFRYRKNIEKPRAFLEPFLDNAIGADADMWGAARSVHDQLLASLAQKAVIVYSSADETISLNGTHFVKNLPAKILRKILVAYSTSGQTIFSHREIAKDRTIFSDPKNPNLVVRLQRLSQAFKKQFPLLSLAKHGRGTISFVPSCKIEFLDL